MTVSQLRVVVETDDFDGALRFYRDALGLPVEASYEGEGDARVAILSIPAATLEIANSAQVRMIDEVEVGRPASRPSTLSVRVAFQVDDAAAVTNRLEEGGAVVVSSPTLTPWNSLNSRLEAPGGMQITAFQELGPDSSPAG
ncbi:MAG: glyoxalase [Glaciihabitans sp.]|nr:glyoxalase [Glaciihabitans sp.]